MKLQENLIGIVGCNAQGIIEEIIYAHEKTLFDVGASIFDKIAMDENKAEKLKNLFHGKDQILDLVLEHPLQEQDKQRVLHGFSMARGYLIMVEEGLYCGEHCQDSYEEIMKLNSQFANAQREVAKKNEELKRMNEKLETVAAKDALTGLFNRYTLQEKFQEVLKRCQRGDSILSMAMVDFNNFKKVNDDWGHEAGDRLLKDFAKLALKETRTGFDYVFRIGGDEFLFLFEGCSEEKAKDILFRIEKELKKYTSIVSLAFGTMEVPIGEDTKLEKLLVQVDEKMYRDKRKKHQKESTDKSRV